MFDEYDDYYESRNEYIKDAAQDIFNEIEPDLLDSLKKYIISKVGQAASNIEVEYMDSDANYSTIYVSISLSDEDSFIYEEIVKAIKGFKFSSSTEGGTSSPKYYWNWDGMQVDYDEDEFDVDIEVTGIAFDEENSALPGEGEDGMCWISVIIELDMSC